jgi:protein SCO1/2
MSRRIFLPFVLFALCAIGAIIAVTVISPGTTGVSGPAIGGPFTLTAQDGRQMSDADFRGHPFLVFFGFTHCPDVCPTSLFEISQVFKELGPDKNIKALFITVDPERDTPPVMKEYVSSFDPRILGLTGSPEAVAAVEKAYRVYSRKVPGRDGEYSMDHTAIIYLMDKEGHFVNAFNIERSPQVAAQELDKYL